MAESVRDAAAGLRIVGAMKLASGLVLGAAGFGIFRLMGGDMGEALGHSIARLHLDPDNRLIHAVITRLSGIDRAHLEAIGAGTFLYAAMHLVEGTGLVLRRRWAEYLTTIATGSLLPLEFVELARKASLVRAGILAANLAILAYVIAELRHRPRVRSGPTAPPRSGTIDDPERIAP